MALAQQGMGTFRASNGTLIFRSDVHSDKLLSGFCSLMQHRSGVDIVIGCGSKVLHAHKVVLSASSRLFQEELKKDPSIEQVIITECEFSAVKSLFEYIYTGEAYVDPLLFKHFVALGHLFQIKSLEGLAKDRLPPNEWITLPMPQFISRKAKYVSYSLNYSKRPENLKPSTDTIFNPLTPLEDGTSHVTILNLKKEAIAPTGSIISNAVDDSYMPRANVSDGFYLDPNARQVLKSNLGINNIFVDNNLVFKTECDLLLGQYQRDKEKMRTEEVNGVDKSEGSVDPVLRKSDEMIGQGGEFVDGGSSKEAVVFSPDIFFADSNGKVEGDEGQRLGAPKDENVMF